MHRKRGTRLAAVLRICGAFVAGLSALVIVGTAIVAPLLQVELSPVLSGSMVPTFAPGDLLLTRPIATRSLRIGYVAILTPVGDSVPRAHRVIGLRTTNITPPRSTLQLTTLHVTTRGDANPTADAGEITVNTPTVRVEFVTIPWAGYPVLWLHDRVLRALLIAALGLLTTAGIFTFLLRPSRPRQRAPGRRSRAH